MSLSKRDAVATGLVAAAAVLYIVWAVGLLPAAMSTRVTGAVILVLGFLASASAVVPSFDQLLHGNKWYLAATSLIGLVAAVAGVMMLVNASGPALGIVMAGMVVLWVLSTIHHGLLAKAHSAPPTATPSDRQPAAH